MRVYRTSREATPCLDRLGAANMHKCDDLGLIGLESQGLSGRQVEMIAIRFLANKFKVIIDLHEMEV